MNFDAIAVRAILVMLAISSVLTIAEALGFLPSRVSRWLNRNRISFIFEILKEFGVDVSAYERHNAARRINKFGDAEGGENLENKLKEITIRNSGSPIYIGATNSVSVIDYIDLMSASVNPAQAEFFSRCLSKKLNDLMVSSDGLVTSRFDFVCTPKNGSPILGFMFARVIQKPFALHNGDDKFWQTDLIQSRFDIYPVPPKGTTALIVDDSTTGGRMVINLITDLRRFGYKVTDCLVVFEPQIQNKDARKVLNEANVKLHSIVKTHV